MKRLGRHIVLLLLILFLVILLTAAAAVVYGCIHRKITWQRALMNNMGITSSSLAVEGNYTESAVKSISYEIDGELAVKNSRLQVEGTLGTDYLGIGAEFPLYLDAMTDDLDFDIYFGMPDILRLGIISPFGGSDTIFFDEDGLKSALSPADFASQAAILKNSRSREFLRVLTDWNTVITKYFADSECQAFREIEGEKIYEGGVYTIRLDKADIAAITAAYFGNEKYFGHFHDYVLALKETGGEDFDAGVFSSGDPELVLAEANRVISGKKSLSLEVVLTIRGGFLTESEVTCDVDGNESYVHLELYDINEEVSINGIDDDKSDMVNLKDFIEIWNQFRSLFGV